MAEALYIGQNLVGYYPPTYASEILTSGGDTVEQALNPTGELLTTNNTTYVTDANNKVSILKIGKLCVISGRFVTSAVKPAGQDPFYTVPKPANNAVIPVSNISGIAFIITDDGKLTANAQVSTGTYNIMCAYLTQ